MYKTQLCEWGFEQYIERFDDEEIDDDAFLVLTPEVIRSIFTKVGPYCKFLKKYNAFKCCTDYSSYSASSVEKSTVTEPATINDMSNVGITSCIEEDGIYNLQSDGSLTKEINNINTPSDITSTSKRGDPLLKKKKLESNERQDFPFIKEGFIHEALQNNYKGTLAILEYSKSGRLSPNTQQHVAECVLLLELKGDIEKRITASRFMELAGKIKEYFPSESELTYYTPYYKDRNGKKHGSSGKLIDLLYNIRRKATKAGIRIKPKNLFVEDTTSEGTLGEGMAEAQKRKAEEPVTISKIYEAVKARDFIEDLWSDIVADIQEKPTYKRIKEMVNALVNNTIDEFSDDPLNEAESLKRRTKLTEISIMTYTVDTIISELLSKKMMNEFQYIVENIVREIKPDIAPSCRDAAEPSNFNGMASYVIVEFQGTKQYAVVPENWVEDGFCSWPPTELGKKLQPLIEKGIFVSSGATWSRRSVRIIGDVYDSWNTAQCKFKESLETSGSDINTTDVDNHGRGKSGESKRKENPSVSSSDSEDEVQIPPEFKQIVKSENLMEDFETEQYSSMNLEELLQSQSEQFHGSQLLHLGNQLPATDASTQMDSESLLSPQHPSKKRKIEGQSMTDFEQRMLESVELLELKVDALTEGMDFLRQRMQENPPLKFQGINDLIEIMPLSNVTDIAKMERELTNKEKFEEMKLYLKRIGGSNCDRIVRNIMNQVITSNSATQYSFFGRRKEKGAFKETNLYKVIIGAVSLQHNIKDVSEYEINKSIQSWLRHAKARCKHTTESEIQ